MKRIAKRVFQQIKQEVDFRKKFVAYQHRFEETAKFLADDRFVCKWEDRWPCLDDATSTTGFDPHYLYHTAWAIRILAETLPEKHIDISSCLRFVSMASALVPIVFYDYRPAAITLPNLSCEQADITSLPFPDATVHSLSCMHVVEHIGMQRYGDSFDPRGDLKAIAELRRVLATGGQLLFVVPVGGFARIQYNAHRIYTYSQVISYFPDLVLQNFALIKDSGEFVSQATPDLLAGQLYSCGCFRFVRA